MSNVKTHHEPLLRMAKRDGIATWKSVAIRIVAVLIALILSGLFIYAVTVVLKSSGAQFQQLIAPLPFVTISDSMLYLFNFTGAHYTTVCSELLSMIILSFLVNLADGWLPKGKNIISWLFFRCLTVVIAFLLHLIVVGLFATYLPEGLVTYTPRYCWRSL